MHDAIQHDATTRRFSANVDEMTGYLEYELAGDVMTITHTIVPPSIGGRGIAGELVKAALEHAREAGWKVVSRCSYADSWKRKHPEYEGLQA